MFLTYSGEITTGYVKTHVHNIQHYTMTQLTNTIMEAINYVHKCLYYPEVISFDGRHMHVGVPV